MKACCDLVKISESLPSRERGLKFEKRDNSANQNSSLPSRERGLKYDAEDGNLSRMLSLPSRERGLKFALDINLSEKDRRSLHGSVD